MIQVRFCRALILFVASQIIIACQPPDFSEIKPDFSKITMPGFTQIKAVPDSILKIGKKFSRDKGDYTEEAAKTAPIPLQEVLDGSLADKNQGVDFIASLKYALETDPIIIGKRRELDARLAAIGVARARKDFQVGTTVYGGIEDLSDSTRGLALALDASRMVFDGGKMDLQITSSILAAEAAEMDLIATINMRADELAQKWLELEKYKSLQGQIDRRLSVLDPLIDQLEKVAQAGIGDVSRVTAAQRTVSAIRVEETSVAQGLAQAQLEFSNAFGMDGKEVAFDYDFISNLMPSEIDDKLVQQSPLLKSQYLSYQLGLVQVAALRAKDGFDIGFEARVMRPFAGSEYDSDESIGLVGRKTIFNGGMLESEIKQAEAVTEASLAEIQVTYRRGTQSINASMQNIESLEKSLLISKENVKLTSDEIAYLRQQLIIGGSTLDSVLTAEANLYEAESKEIFILTEKYKSKVRVLSSLGLFSSAIGF